MTLEKAINKLGDNYRGLWRSYTLSQKKKIKKEWSLTFAYGLKMVETPFFDKPIDCFFYAFKILKINP